VFSEFYSLPFIRRPALVRCCQRPGPIANLRSQWRIARSTVHSLASSDVQTATFVTGSNSPPVNQSATRPLQRSPINNWRCSHSTWQLFQKFRSQLSQRHRLLHTSNIKLEQSMHFSLFRIRYNWLLLNPLLDTERGFFRKIFRLWIFGCVFFYS
jgi:hypothetical protein